MSDPMPRFIEATVTINGQPRTITRTVATKPTKEPPDKESSKKIPASPSTTPSRRR